LTREQAYCHFSPALIANLERNWDAKNRKIGRPQPRIEWSFASQHASAKRGGFLLAKIIQRTHPQLLCGRQLGAPGEFGKGPQKVLGVWKHAST
jgi:hypothetical protein